LAWRLTIRLPASAATIESKIINIPGTQPLLAIVVAAQLSSAVAFAQSGSDTTREVVARAVAGGPKSPHGPFAPTWESLRANYQTPEWFRDAKFGIFLHRGIYSVPAHAMD
jgi:hypothetical protein